MGLAFLWRKGVIKKIKIVSAMMLVANAMKKNKAS